jgi:hypothetical protein
MRYALECPVESKIRLAADFYANWFGKLLTLTRGEDGFVNKIRLETAIPPGDRLSQTFAVTEEGAASIKAEGGVKTHRRLEADLQSIESSLAFYFGLKRIRWEHSTSIAIAETEEEKAQVQFSNFRYRRDIDDKPRDVAVKDLAGVLEIAYACGDLSTVLAFYREGCNDMDTQRYITAYFSFYFVVEGLYANGKSNKDVVRQNFLKSEVLTRTVQAAVAAGLPPRPATGDVYTIESLLKRFNRSYDVVGVLDMLILMRGDLHHFLNKRTKPTGNPFTHHRYEGLAQFMRVLTNRVLLEEMNFRTKAPT